MNIQSSFTVYTAALHALILNYLLLAHFLLGLSWIDLDLLYFSKQSFSSPKTSSRTPYSNSKQQERQKHSAENTINFSATRKVYSVFSTVFLLLLLLGLAALQEQIALHSPTRVGLAGQS